MDAELARLEEKVCRLAKICTDLREENRSLRQKMLLLEQSDAQLKQKLNDAGERVAAILAKIPEEAQ